MFKAIRTTVTALAATMSIGSTQGQAQELSLTNPYLRVAIGQGWSKIDNGMWHSPGPADPDVFFNLSGGNPITGTFAFGASVAPGWRAELAIMTNRRENVAGPWTRTVPVAAGPHADITAASVRTTAMMVNAAFAPFEVSNPDARIQPFVIGGVGVARNSVGSWTRTNAAAVRPVRSFEGADKTSFAWSVGVGASVNISQSANRPLYLEGMVQYFDFGAAQGGATPLPGNGASQPITPLKFDNRSTVVSFGVRIPLN